MELLTSWCDWHASGSSEVGRADTGEATCVLAGYASTSVIARIRVAWI
jgi:hypothetical protein